MGLLCLMMSRVKAQIIARGEGNNPITRKNNAEYSVSFFKSRNKGIGRDDVFAFGNDVLT